MIKRTLIIILIILIFSSSSSILAEDFRNTDKLPESKINFNFSNESLTYVFQAIAKASNMNIIVNIKDKENIDQVTLELDNITAKNAIQLITNSYDLDYVYKDNVLIIDTKENIRKKYNDELVTGAGTGSLIVSDPVKSTGEMIVNEKIEDEKKTENNFEKMEGLNKGTLIPAKLQLGLVSSSKKRAALVRVTKTIKYKGETVIPKGAVLTGYGITDYGVRQIFVELDTLIVEDREIDIKAHMVKKDGTPGFRSEYKDLSMENLWPKLLLSLVSDVIGGAKDVTYIDNGQPVEESTVKNNLIERTQDGVDNFQNQIKNDAQKHQAIISVDAGVEGYIFIDQKIPLNDLIDNGEDENEEN